jgi:hypothetical protein
MHVLNVFVEVQQQSLNARVRGNVVSVRACMILSNLTMLDFQEDDV